MNKFVRLAAIAGLLLAGASYATDTTYRIDQLPQLRQEPEHATVSERVTSRFTRSHYRQFALDDQFSAKYLTATSICWITAITYCWHQMWHSSRIKVFAGQRVKIRSIRHAFCLIQSGTETPF